MIPGAWKTLGKAAFWKRTLRDIDQNHTLAFAAGLSYYFLLSLFPALIVLAAVVGFVPVPDLFGRILSILSHVVPPDGMILVRRITHDIITPHHGAFFWLGLLGVLWTSTTGFAAMIEALNVAYNVPETRAYWKARTLALMMAIGVGALLFSAVVVQILGPDFGRWLAHRFGLGPLLKILWPYLRWGVTMAFTLTAIDATYKVAPNVRQRQFQVVPGVIVASIAWVLLSFGLGIYFRSIAHFNKTYGVLGAAIALMMWFYYTGFVILVGGTVNAELMRFQGAQLELKEPVPSEAEPESVARRDAAA